MLFHNALACNVKQNTNQSQPVSIIPKKLKHKFIKQLNLKSKAQIKSKSFSFKSNSALGSRRIDLQKNQPETTHNTLQSLLQATIKGAQIIKGQWKDNKMNGHFIIEYENGCRFQGLFENNLKVRGKMIYRFAKCTYQGSFFGQKFSGNGILSYEEGRTIEGQWDNMQFLGNATITYPNGDVYYGPVDQKLYKHGEGYLFFNNGRKYIEAFRHGSITGFGSYYKDEQLIKTGLWRKGELVRQIQNQQASMMGSQYQLNNFSKQISDLSMTMIDGKQRKQDNQLSKKIRLSFGSEGTQHLSTQQSLIH